MSCDLPQLHFYSCCVCVWLFLLQLKRTRATKFGIKFSPGLEEPEEAPVLWDRRWFFKSNRGSGRMRASKSDSLRLLLFFQCIVDYCFTFFYNLIEGSSIYSAAKGIPFFVFGRTTQPERLLMHSILFFSNLFSNPPLLWPFGSHINRIHLTCRLNGFVRFAMTTEIFGIWTVQLELRERAAICSLWIVVNSSRQRLSSFR